MSTKSKRKKAVLGDVDPFYQFYPSISYANNRIVPGLTGYNSSLLHNNENNTIPYGLNIVLPEISDDIDIEDIPIEVPEYGKLNTKVGFRQPKLQSIPILNQAVNPTPSTIAGERPIVKPYTPSILERYGLNKGDIVAGGIQLAGNLASSIVNQIGINKLGFTPIHTMTVAETPVKFDTNYDINPQIDELRETEAANEREIRDNTASSQNVVGRTIGSRFRTNRGYNELYGYKLNQQGAIKNAEAQNRQGVYQRNTDRLQRNLYRDEAYNTQGEDNLRNTKATLTGQNWSNFAQQAAGSLIGAYNRGQQRISDANSLGFLLASNPNSANLFMNNNSLINRIFRTAKRMQGIYG